MNSINPLDTATALTVATAASRQQADGGEDFSGVLTAAMSRAMGAGGWEGSLSAAALLPDDPLNYLPYTLLAEEAAGQPDNNAMMIYMLMCMMQEFKNSDTAPLMAVLSALNPQAGSNNYGAPIPDYLPQQAWLPATFSHVFDATNRNATALNKVINQFEVESAERYRPHRDGNTYCNIFVWDVTRALGCEIPHYVEEKSGDPRYYPDVKGAVELDANGVSDWLSKRGADYGWQEITAAEAQQYANSGYPVVGAWYNNSGGPGHVLMVCPSRAGAYDPLRGVTVAQAGGRNYSYAYINAAMSADKIAQTKYYIHA